MCLRKIRRYFFSSGLARECESSECNCSCLCAEYGQFALCAGQTRAGAGATEEDADKDAVAALNTGAEGGNKSHACALCSHKFSSMTQLKVGAELRDLLK